VVILVDDGLATGYTARAAIEHVRRRGARLRSPRHSGGAGGQRRSDACRGR
jgi:hypothetical protein